LYSSSPREKAQDNIYSLLYEYYTFKRGLENKNDFGLFQIYSFKKKILPLIFESKEKT